MNTPLAKDPSLVFTALGLTPDPWQRTLVASREIQTHVLCSRQSGKSFSVSAKALCTAILHPASLTVVVSPAQHQSAEVLRNVKLMHHALLGKRVQLRPWSPRPVRADDFDPGPIPEPVTDAALHHELSNGSRIVCVPATKTTSVGKSAVSLLILDEASRIPDEVYYPLRPLLAASRYYGEGQLVALSTPFGKRGWFYEAWKQCEDATLYGKPEPWQRIRVPATDCPRLRQTRNPDGRLFLEAERESMGEHWYMQEYELAFRDVIDAVFSSAEIEGMLDRSVEMWDLPA